HRLRRVMVAFGFALGLVGWGFGAVKTRPTTMVLVAGGAAFVNELLGLIHERGWYRWWLVYALSLFDVLLVAVLVVWFGRGGFVAVRAPAGESDELGFLERSFNRMIEEIGGTISTVQREADEVAALAEQLAASAEELHATSETVTHTAQRLATDLGQQREMAE